MADPEDTKPSQENPDASDAADSDADPTAGDSLEAPETSDASEPSKEVEEQLDATGDKPGSANTSDSGSDSNPAPEPASKPAKSGRLSGFKNWYKDRLNIYLLVFVLLLVLAGAVILIAYQQNKHSSTERLKTQGLSQKTLDELANGDVTVGDNQTVLNVRSSAVFAGQVLVRKDLEVAGNLRIGGTVALNNITISGTSQLGQATVNRDLAVGGNTSLQGTATIGKSLQVGGGGTFSGPLSAPQITTSSLQLNGDLALTHHITTSGGQPSRSSGSALGGGGSVSVSGSDTAGSISINTGSGPAAGCFVTVNFTSKFSSTPHIQVTPVSSPAGGLSYYINRSTTNFSICVSTPPPAGSSFGFDYFVID